ncbi:TPA: transglycosylase, partial [Campylobacter jejuni]|nr:transglycosylase [Campylobacter jejuni]
MKNYNKVLKTKKTENFSNSKNYEEQVVNWQQYFPTYHFDYKKNRDIALEEYKFCCKILESEERIFDNLIKYMLTFGTIIISLLSGASEKIKAIFKDVTENPNYIIWFIIALV